LIGCSDNSMDANAYRYTPGFDQTSGAAPLSRGPNFNKMYSRCNFTYLMNFCRFVPFKGEGSEVDIPALVASMKDLRDNAGCTAGVGIYWDCTLDKSERGGLWSRSGKNPDAYRARAKEMDDAIAKAGLP